MLHGQHRNLPLSCQLFYPCLGISVLRMKDRTSLCFVFHHSLPQFFSLLFISILETRPPKTRFGTSCTPLPTGTCQPPPRGPFPSSSPLPDPSPENVSPLSPVPSVAATSGPCLSDLSRPLVKSSVLQVLHYPELHTTFRVDVPKFVFHRTALRAQGYTETTNTTLI